MGVDPEIEGGDVDAHGNPILGRSTMEDYLEGNAEYVTVAMDKASSWQGQHLESPNYPGVPFKVMDNGGFGNNKTGNGWVDIAFRDPEQARNMTEQNVPFRPIIEERAKEMVSNRAKPPKGFVLEEEYAAIQAAGQGDQDEDRIPLEGEKALEPPPGFVLPEHYGVEEKAGPQIEEGSIAGKVVETSNDIWRALQRGWKQGEVAMELQKPDPNLDEVTQKQKEIERLPASQDYLDTWDDKKSWKESWEAFQKNPIGNLGQLVAESMGSMVRTQLRFPREPRRALSGVRRLVRLWLGSVQLRAALPEAASVLRPGWLSLRCSRAKRMNMLAAFLPRFRSRASTSRTRPSSSKRSAIRS